MKFSFLVSFCLVSFSVFCQEGTVNIDQDKGINQLLEYKKDIKTLRLYTIQIYQSVDPDKAYAQRSAFRNNFADWPAYIKWFTPNYKVWVGDFCSRLEADRALAQIQKKYPNANVLLPKFGD